MAIKDLTKQTIHDKQDEITRVFWAVCNKRIPYNQRQDVVQDCWVALMQKYTKYDPTKANPISFLYMIANNECGMWYRREKRHQNDMLDNVELLVACGEIPTDIQDKLDICPCLNMAIQGYTQDEIAQTMGKSRSLISRRIKQERDLIRGIL